MAKPILKSNVGESVQHPSGKLSKQISREQLIKDYKVYVHTHAHLYENAEELKMELSMQGGKITKALGVNVRAVMSKVGGVATPVFVANGVKQTHSDQKANVAKILQKLAQKPTQPIQNETKTKTGRGKK